MNNIIFDGNYLFHRSMFIINLNSKGKLLESEKQQKQFIRKIATDMSYVIRQFGKPKRVIFTIDSKSWRKEIEIIENEGYKSHKEKTSEIDWDNFYRCMDRFGEIIKEKGFIVSKIEKAEGDDLMYLWSQFLLNNKENSVVVTGDRDLFQIVRIKNKNFTVIYNPNTKQRKIYGSKGIVDLIYNQDKYIDLFDSSTYFNNYEFILNGLKNSELKEIDTDKFIKIKVLIGDDGDNVPGVFYWKSKNGKTNRITEKRAENIINYINNKLQKNWSVFDFPKLSNIVSDGIKLVTKQNVNENILKQKLERNIKLVVLHKDVIPNEIVEKFKLHFKENINSKKINLKEFKMDLLLENTEFFEDKEKTYTSDIFKGLTKK